MDHQVLAVAPASVEWCIDQALMESMVAESSPQVSSGYMVFLEYLRAVVFPQACLETLPVCKVYKDQKELHRASWVYRLGVLALLAFQESHRQVFLVTLLAVSAFLL